MSPNRYLTDEHIGHVVDVTVHDADLMVYLRDVIVDSIYRVEWDTDVVYTFRAGTSELVIDSGTPPRLHKLDGVPVR